MVATCSGSCTWSEPAASGDCTGTPVECQPGREETGTANCTTCGTRNHKRTCAADCTWGDWGDTSDCTWCEQCSRVAYCNEDGPRNIVCQQDACSREQACADCLEDIVMVCGYAGGDGWTIDYLP
jgi:hypothetical protein